mmetsp:Transcript_18748/g.63533  ORF Transcript_18748/g.63533 Transcript_18748/m.63533 type:complete len:208 (-) Transcript_18748:594-1217(-)
MAHMSAAPRATASSAFSVVPSPKLSADWSSSSMDERRRLTHSTRVPPPTISTAERSEADSPAPLSAAVTGASRRSTRGATRPSNVSRVSPTLKSVSSMRHSTLSRASGTPVGDSVFLAFSAAAASLSMAFLLAVGSMPVLLRNCSAAQTQMASSKSRPPRLRSEALLSMRSWPFFMPAMDTVVLEWPMSMNMACDACSASNSLAAER